MTEFRVEVVQIGKVENHPNADSLSITDVYGGYPCIIRTGEFNEGDLAVYVPIDAICPIDASRFSFLGKHNRIKAKKLRGIFSMGLLTKAEPEWSLGQNVQSELGIEKYDLEAVLEAKARSGGKISGGQQASDPGYMPKYDMEGYRRYKSLFQVGEPVVITEKVHGSNARYVYLDGKLHVASKNLYRKESEDCTWWKIAKQYNLEEKLSKNPGLAFYGEIYGDVQDLKYGCKSGELKFSVFDIYDTEDKLFLDSEQFNFIMNDTDLPKVPILKTGSFEPEDLDLSEGQSTLGNHVREGIVIKSAVEKNIPHFGRAILKLVGQGYLLR